MPLNCHKFSYFCAVENPSVDGLARGIHSLHLPLRSAQQHPCCIPVLAQEYFLGHSGWFFLHQLILGWISGQHSHLPLSDAAAPTSKSSSGVSPVFMSPLSSLLLCPWCQELPGLCQHIHISPRPHSLGKFGWENTCTICPALPRAGRNQTKNPWNKKKPHLPLLCLIVERWACICDCPWLFHLLRGNLAPLITPECGGKALLRCWSGR